MTMNDDAKYRTFGALATGALVSYKFDGATPEQVVEALEVFAAVVDLHLEP